MVERSDHTCTYPDACCVQCCDCRCVAEAVGLPEFPTEAFHVVVRDVEDFPDIITVTLDVPRRRQPAAEGDAAEGDGVTADLDGGHRCRFPDEACSACEAEGPCDVCGVTESRHRDPCFPPERERVPDNCLTGFGPPECTFVACCGAEQRGVRPCGHSADYDGDEYGTGRR